MEVEVRKQKWTRGKFCPIYKYNSKLVGVKNHGFEHNKDGGRWTSY